MEKVSATNEETYRGYNEAVDLIEQSLSAEDDSEGLDKWQRALILAGLCRNRDERNPDFNYLLGYVYCNAPRKTEENWRNAERFLRIATQLNPAHHLARYHLASVLFSLRRWRESLDQLNLIPPTVFDYSGQPWRTAKVKELQMCCALYIDPEMAGLADAENLKDCFASFADPFLAPIPAEFADCIVLVGKTKQLSAERLAPLARICVKIFESVGASDVLLERWPCVYDFAAKSSS